MLRDNSIPNHFPRPGRLRPTSLLDAEVADGAEHVPLPGRIFSRRVPRQVHDAVTPSDGHQLGQPDGADARLGDKAHGRDVQLRLRRDGPEVPPQHLLRLPRERRQTHVDEGDEWRSDVRHEYQGCYGTEGGYSIDSLVLRCVYASSLC